jgi:hypothetical protein
MNGSMLPAALASSNTKLSIEAQRPRAKSLGEPQGLVAIGALAHDLDHREFALDGIAPQGQIGDFVDRQEPLQHCGQAHPENLSFKCHTNLFSLGTASGR